MRRKNNLGKKVTTGIHSARHGLTSSEFDPSRITIKTLNFFVAQSNAGAVNNSLEMVGQLNAQAVTLKQTIEDVRNAY